MAGDAFKFTTLILKDQGNVTYGDNRKANVIGEGNILVNKDLSIKNVTFTNNIYLSIISIGNIPLILQNQCGELGCISRHVP